MNACFLALMLLFAVATAERTCGVGSKDYKNGEEWDVLPGRKFIMKCVVAPSGDWSVEFVACKTKTGRRMKVGESVSEGKTDYKCEKQANGNPLLTVKQNAK